jgi:hypothetical protein
VRAVSILLNLVSLAILTALVWALFFAPPRDSIYILVGDDAGYYLAIARNLCLGHGFSFDRLHETNGFNPLLTALLVVADRALDPGLSITGCYRVGLLITFLAMLGGGAALLRIADAVLDPAVIRNGSRHLLLAASIAYYVWFVCLKSNYGMDGPLVLALGTLYLLRVVRHGLLAPGSRAAALDGLLLGLLFLARVDSLPMLAAAFGLMAVMVLARRAGPGRLAARAGWAALVATPYVAWSWARFHTWLPVSARIKTAFPHLDLPRSLEVVRHSSLNAADQASFMLGFAVALAMVVGHLAPARLRRLPEVLSEGRAAALAVLTVYVLARVGYLLAFSRTDVQGSYVILVHVYNLLMGLAATSALARRVSAATAQRLCLAAAAALTLVSGVMLAGKLVRMRAWYQATQPGGPGDDAALAAAIHDRTRPEDIIYGEAFGLLGFFADRAWINGDGVANTFAYQEALRDDRLEQYLTANRVTHVVFVTPRGAVEPPGARRLAVRSALYGRSGAYSVDDHDVLLSWPSSRGGGTEVHLARWSPPGAP